MCQETYQAKKKKKKKGNMDVNNAGLKIFFKNVFHMFVSKAECKQSFVCPQGRKTTTTTTEVRKRQTMNETRTILGVRFILFQHAEIS